MGQEDRAAGDGALESHSESSPDLPNIDAVFLSRHRDAGARYSMSLLLEIMGAGSAHPRLSRGQCLASSHRAVNETFQALQGLCP